MIFRSVSGSSRLHHRTYFARLAEGTTDLMQRLACLPKAPKFNTLRRRKPVRSALSHIHHLHIRWCLLRAYTNIKAFRGESRFSTWLTRIGINQALMCLRARRRPTISLDYVSSDEDFITLDLPDSRPNPEQLVSARKQSYNHHRNKLRDTARGWMSKQPLCGAYGKHSTRKVLETELLDEVVDRILELLIDIPFYRTVRLKVRFVEQLMWVRCPLRRPV
jgi:hypothetical protein